MKNLPSSFAVPWINELEPPILRELDRSFHVARLRKERTLFYQEDNADTAFLVLDGSVRHQKWTDTGSTILVNHTYQGEWCGLAETCRRGVYLTDATSITNSVVASIRTPDLFRLLNHDSFRRRVITDLAGGYYTLHGIIESPSPRSKICKHLLFLLSNPSQPSDGTEIKVTQESIAHAVGLSRETVNKHLKELEVEQIVQMSRGEIRVVDLQRLEGAANL